MWWILTALTVAIFWLLAVLLGFIPPPHAKTIIRIHNGKIRITRGQVRAQPREFISDIVQQTGMTTGYIAVTHYNRASFSRNIPGDIQQRIRNVLLNTP
jgi:hypothetical protein